MLHYKDHWVKTKQTKTQLCGRMLKLYVNDSFSKLFVKYPAAHVASIFEEYHCGLLVPDMITWLERLTFKHHLQPEGR